ncbi:biotin transporter BioY, partial [Bacillus sp. B-TM1]
MLRLLQICVIRAFVIGYLIERLREVSIIKVLCINIIGGIFVVYVFGIIVQAFVMDISIWQTMKVSVAFLPGDCIKAIIAAILVTKLHRSLKHIITPALKSGKYTKAG